MVHSPTRHNPTPTQHDAPPSRHGAPPLYPAQCAPPLPSTVCPYAPYPAWFAPTPLTRDGLPLPPLPGMEEERGPDAIELVRGITLAKRYQTAHIVHAGDLNIKIQKNYGCVNTKNGC